jgi:Undecaprenyl-phosphate glucose phosphotransferase
MAIDVVAAGGVRRERGNWFRYDLVGHAAAVADFVVIAAANMLCGSAYGFLKGNLASALTGSLALGVLFAVLFVLLMQMRGLYSPIALLQPLRQFSNALALWIAVTAFLTLIGFALKAGHMISRGATVSFVLVGFALVILLRFSWHSLMRHALDKGTFATRRIAIVGDEETLDRAKLAQTLEPFGLSIAMRFRLPSEAVAERTILTAVISDIVAGLRGSQIDEVVVALGRGRFELAENLISGLRILPLPIKLVLDAKLGDLLTRPSQRFGQEVVAVEMHRAPMTIIERSVKRMLDVIVAGVTLLLAAPLLVITAIAIRLESRGPVLFKQTRNGFNNRPFQILKFRSMHVMEDGATVRQASRRDNRVTRVGRWIRKLSIDELPQLWNVLRGEMSMVGPRPHALTHDAYYETLIGGYPYRQHVKPGLTGWAQVNGSRGETPTLESMATRVRLDLWYVENASIWLDIRIIARTFATLLNVRHTY